MVYFIAVVRTCEQLDQRPNNGFLTCRYTEHTNGYICFIKCLDGHFFVSGINNYVTCGSATNFEWSHRVVNKTARIPACTSKFLLLELIQIFSNRFFIIILYQTRFEALI